MVKPPPLIPSEQHFILSSPSPILAAKRLCPCLLRALPGALFGPGRAVVIHFSAVWLSFAGSLVPLSVVAVIVVWVRRRSVLDLWLMVVMSAYVIELCMIAFPIPARFSFGWYAGRVFGLLSGSLLLFVLLYA